MTTPVQIAQIDTPTGFIDLGRGDPGFDLLPLEMLRGAAEERLRGNDNRFLQYGAELGDGHLREALAGFLTEGYGFPVGAESLFISSGISAALDLLCTLYTRWGDTVFVEEPSYFLALRIFADHGLRVVSVPTDESGVAVEAFEDALRQEQPKFLYFIPTFQNPTGHTLTEERRQRLLQIARERGLLLVADEVYQLLNYTSTPPGSFAAHIENECVISLGSFSKILAPGLRLGWIQAHPKVLARLAGSGLLDSGGGMNPFTSAIVRGVVESGDLARNIDGLKSIYSRRVKTMAQCLRAELPQAEFHTPDGGYFFWLRFREIELEEFRSSARENRVDFRPGGLFSSREGLGDYMRLSIAFHNEDEIKEGVSRLAHSLQRK